MSWKMSNIMFESIPKSGFYANLPTPGPSLPIGRGALLLRQKPVNIVVRYISAAPLPCKGRGAGWVDLLYNLVHNDLSEWTQNLKKKPGRYQYLPGFSA